MRNEQKSNNLETQFKNTYLLIQTLVKQFVFRMK